MIINFISYNNGYGLTKDMQILKDILENNYKNIDIKFYGFYEHNIRESDVNIFFEILSNIVIKKARYNILIPNQEWFYKNWQPYLENIDLVLAKTKYSENIFSNFTKTEFIGWESEDLLNNEKKDYNSFIHSCGKSMYKQTQLILDNWDISYPHLTVLYHKDKLKLNCPIQENITYICNKIESEELKLLMNKKGIHICCSETEGYGHYINEARSCKSVVLTTDSEPMNNFISSKQYLVKVDKKIKLKNVFGYKSIIDVSSFKNVIDNVIESKKKYLIAEGEKNRENFLKEREIFRNSVKRVFDSIFSNLPEKNSKVLINKENLPKISVVTITRNRERFIKLCLLNIFQSDYPDNKIEWIIIDDSDVSIKNLLPENSFIKYYYYNEKLSIGKKRNIGVEKSSNDYILFMDDDDYYPPESFTKRITNLLHYNKDCVFCSSIGCFHINKYISIMNVPPHQDAFHERVSEATLCFKKSFWNKKKFLNDCNGSEGAYFIKDRYSECLELEPEEIIVSLLHSSNTSTKDLVIDEPNGCHFNFSNNLFSFITKLDNTKKELI